MVANTLAFLAGICLLQFTPGLPGPALACLLAISAAAAVAVTRLPLFVAVFAAGLLWAWLHAFITLPTKIFTGPEKQDLLVRGRVAGLPQSDSRHGRKFVLLTDKVKFIDSENWNELEVKLRLRWYSSAPDIKPGDMWQLNVRLKPPHGYANPGSQDYERWLFANGFSATGYIRKSEHNQLIKQSNCRQIDCWRTKLSRALEGQGNKAVSGLIRALAVGDRNGISDRQWQVLRSTGTAHLMAISGLHIGLVAGLVFTTVRRFCARTALVKLWPAPKLAALATILVATCYALLAGFGLPTQRALITVCVFMMATLMGRKVPVWRSFAISLWLILLLDPLSVLSTGFWLSFGAVAWILFMLAGRHGESSKLVSSIRIQLALSVGLLPLMLLGFQQTALISPLANLIAVPLVGLLVVPMLLAGMLCLGVFPALAGGLVTAAATVLDATFRLLDAMALTGSWQHAVPGYWLIFTGVAGTLLLLAPKGLPVRVGGSLLVCPLLLARPDLPETGAVWLTLLDVGQGLSAVVRTRNHTLLFDAGPGSTAGFNTGTAVVVPYLVHNGIKQLDVFLISHSDNDHMGGAESVFKQLDVQSILSGTPEKIAWAKSQRCREGQSWFWDGVEFEILAPAGKSSGNNASCVLRVTASNGRRILLTGDIEAAVEKQLVARQADKLSADIIVVPHHGSRTSSTQRFVGKVDPDIVIVPAGSNNRFGFPKPDIIARYNRPGARIFVTGLDGAVEARTNTEDLTIRITGFRDSSRRYWYKRYSQ